MSGRGMVSLAAWLALGWGVAAHGATKPRIAGTVSPVYPEASRRAQEHGNVLIRVAVAKDGSIGDVMVAKSSGFDALDASALEAVKQWKFTPATDDAGAAVDGVLQFNVRFDLEDTPAAPPPFDEENRARIEDEWRGLVDLSTLVDRLTRKCGPLLKTGRSALKRYPEFYEAMAAEVSVRDAWLRAYFKDYPERVVDRMLLEDRRMTGVVIGGVIERLIPPAKASIPACEKLAAAIETAMQRFIQTKTIDWNAPDLRVISAFHDKTGLRKPLDPRR